MMLFFVGVLEMLVLTTWTKMVTKTMILASGAVTMANMYIWYYVLQKIVNDLDNWHLVFSYALGCSLGTMLTTSYFKMREGRNELSK